MELDFTTKIKAINIDRLTFDDTSDELAKKADESYKLLYDIDWDSIPKIAPPKNSSKTVKDELLTMQSIQKEWNPPSELLKKADDEPADFVFDSVNFNEIWSTDSPSSKKNVEPLLETALEDLNIFIMKMKMFFKRARPYQVSEYHGVSLDYNKKIQGKNGTASTPSYPSGHTASAYFAAEIVAIFYPELKREAFNNANKVALSRIKEGVHFPSDNEYSKLLVSQVVTPAFVEFL